MGTPRDMGRAFPDNISALIEPFVEKGDHFLLAVSGGADSTALLRVMATLFADTPSRLSCLHIDHGLRSREEAIHEETFVRELCTACTVPLAVVHIAPGSLAERARETGDSLEALARDRRHRALARRREELLAALPASSRVWIVLAHNLNDRREGLLLRVLRGAGPEGLVPLPLCDPPLLRPLIETSRSDIESWLGVLGQSWCEDPSNRDTLFLRNRIRHRLIPLLDAEFPFWRGGLEAFGETQALVASDISERLDGPPHWEPRDEGPALAVELSAFMNLSLLSREAFIFKGVDMLMALPGAARASVSPDRLAAPLPRVPRRAVVRRFASLPGGACDLGPCLLTCGNGRLVLAPKETVHRSFHVQVSAPGSYSLEGLVLRLSKIDTGESGAVWVDLPIALAIESGPKRGELDVQWRDIGGREGAFVRKGAKITVHLSTERVHSKGMYCCTVLPAASPMMAGAAAQDCSDTAP